MVVTDLDGTLFQPHARLSPVDRDTLLALGAGGTRRVAATGRSLFSARKVMGAEFPIDYLVFSSGAGVLAWPSQSLLRSSSLSAADVETAARVLLEAGLDFMVHRPIPDNHHFRYYAASGRENPDFRRRCEIYSEFARAGDPQAPVFEEACQLLAVDADPRSGRHEVLRRRLAHLQVIRATSPLDGRSVWIEIFPRSVSKALGAAWLAEREGIDPREVLAVGNDYNDLDLLQWAGSSFVVANAPADLRARFRTVPSNEENGFSRAVELWRGERETGRRA
jgi:hypothetical protein